MGLSSGQATDFVFKQVNFKEVKKSEENTDPKSQETLWWFYLASELDILWKANCMSQLEYIRW